MLYVGSFPSNDPRVGFVRREYWISKLRRIFNLKLSVFPSSKNQFLRHLESLNLVTFSSSTSSIFYRILLLTFTTTTTTGCNKLMHHMLSLITFKIELFFLVAFRQKKMCRNFCFFITFQYFFSHRETDESKSRNIDAEKKFRERNFFT